MKSDGMRSAGLRRDAIRSQVIDVLEAQEIKETDNEEDSTTRTREVVWKVQGQRLTIGLNLGDRPRTEALCLEVTASLFTLPTCLAQ
jgi:hypothetical protein